jgi:hypothetical protein
VLFDPILEYFFNIVFKFPHSHQFLIRIKRGGENARICAVRPIKMPKMWEIGLCCGENGWRRM